MLRSETPGGRPDPDDHGPHCGCVGCYVIWTDAEETKPVRTLTQTVVRDHLGTVLLPQALVVQPPRQGKSHRVSSQPAALVVRSV